MELSRTEAVSPEPEGNMGREKQNIRIGEGGSERRVGGEEGCHVEQQRRRARTEDNRIESGWLSECLVMMWI